MAKTVIVGRNQTGRKKRCHECGELLKPGEKVLVSPSSTKSVYHHEHCITRY